MKIHIHLGAHKTATTFIQSLLHDQRDRLDAASIGYVPLSSLRRDFTNRFEMLYRFDPFWSPILRPYLRARLARQLEAHKAKSLVILSDENLAGFLRMNAVNHGLYKTIGTRAKLLADLLDGHELHFFFATRTYKDYLTSSYLQMAARGKVPNFGKYLAQLPPSMPGWSESVLDLAKAVGKERVTVWDYYHFKADPDAIMNLIAPGAGIISERDEMRRDILPSLTAKGFKVLQRLNGQLSKEEFRRMGKLLRHFPFDAPNERLEITEPKMVADYESKYRDDLARLQAASIKLFSPDHD